MIKEALKRPINVFGIAVPLWAMVIPTAALAVSGLWFATYTLTLNVYEPLSLSPSTGTYNLYAGESKTVTLSVTNAGSEDIDVGIGYVVKSNTNGVLFDVTYNPDDEFTASGNAISTVDVTTTIRDDSPIGTLEMDFKLERLEQ